MKILKKCEIFEILTKKLKKNLQILKKLLKILKSVQEHPKSMWYLEIEASIGRSLKKAKGEKKEEKEENKYFLAFPAEGKNDVSKKYLLSAGLDSI